MEAKRGRPKIIDDSYKVTLYYSKNDYTKLCKIANDYGVSTSFIIRHLISKYLKNPFDISKKN